MLPMDLLTLSRIQFSLTVMFHYIYPPITIGLGVVIVIMETLYMISTEQIPVRHASVMARLLDLAVRNGRHLEFDSEDARAKMVTELPDYERQFYVEHPTCSPPEGMFDNGREAPGEDPPPKKPVQAVQAAETEKVTA